MYRFSIALADQNSCTYGITNWEVKDGFFPAPLHAMTPEQVEDARDHLIRKLSRVVLYTSDLPASDYPGYVKSFRSAHILGIENIRLSAAAVSGASDEQLKKIIAIGASFSIGVLFELEAGSMESFGFDRYAALRCDTTGLVFNPMEFTRAGIRPYTGILSKTKFAPDIRFLRVCDMRQADLQPAQLLKGNGEIKECASKLLTRTYRGYFSFSDYCEGYGLADVIRDFTEALCAM